MRVRIHRPSRRTGSRKYATGTVQASIASVPGAVLAARDADSGAHPAPSSTAGCEPSARTRMHDVRVRRLMLYRRTGAVCTAQKAIDVLRDCIDFFDERKVAGIE